MKRRTALAVLGGTAIATSSAILSSPLRNQSKFTEATAKIKPISPEFFWLKRWDGIKLKLFASGVAESLSKARNALVAGVV